MSLNEIGDFVAGLTAPIAAIWLLFAVYIQINDLTLQRTDIENSLLELNEANKINRENFGQLEKQNRIFRQQFDLERTIRSETLAKSEIATHIYLFVQKIGIRKMRFANESYGDVIFRNIHKYENAIDAGYLFTALQQLYDDIVQLRNSNLTELKKRDKSFFREFYNEYATMKFNIENTFERQSLSSTLINVFRFRIEEIFRVCEEICEHGIDDEDDFTV